MNERVCILVVDDEPVNLHVVESALADTYDILTAQNGNEAIRQIKEKHPALILLDVMMPGLDGFDVCRIIKADETLSDIPIIFLTAVDSVGGEIMGLKLGGIDYLTKPVNLDLLKLRVRNHIELKHKNDLIIEQRDLLIRQKAELEKALARIKQLEASGT
jgi:DNA-binding response OmpR family regulator